MPWISHLLSSSSSLNRSPKKKYLTATILEMCRYHAVPVKVPSRKADLHLHQSPPSSPHPKKGSTHIPIHAHNHNHNHAAQTMDPPPATANSDNNHGTSASSFTDLCFLQEEDDEERGKEWVDDSGSDTDECSTPDQYRLLFPEDQICRILQGVCSCRTQLEAKLLRDVREALRISRPNSAQNEGHRINNSLDLRRFVVSNLRCAGYNAGICKSRWQQTNGYPAGDYEFIDVINVGARGKSDRVLVDMDFRAQFEIARPTAEYAALVEALPDLVVGSADKMRDIIWIMSDAAKRSLKARGLHLPPWRKKRYLEAKWLSSHKRTTQLQGVVECNAWFKLHPRNQYRSGRVNGKGRISGLGRAVAVGGEQTIMTHNNPNDVY